MGIPPQHSTENTGNCSIYAKMPNNARICFKCDFTSKVGGECFEFHPDGFFGLCRARNCHKGLLRTIMWWIWEYKRDWLRKVYTVLGPRLFEGENCQCIFLRNSRSLEADRQFYNWIYQPFNILADNQSSYQPKVLHCITLLWYYCYGKAAMESMIF